MLHSLLFALAELEWRKESFDCGNLETFFESQPVFNAFLTAFLLFLQVPRAITINNSEFVHIIPTEVAGYVLQCSDAVTGSWVLILSKDFSLAAGLCVRGPMGINATMGLTNIMVEDLEKVKESAPLAVSRLKQMSRLHRIKWGD